MPYSPIAVVTGGSAGIGRAIVDALLDRGYRVAVLARGRKRLETLSRIKNGRVWTRSLDVGDGAALERAGDAIVAELGVPDVWVNNAMVTSLSPFSEVGEAEFRKITDTVYLGTVNGCRTALRIDTDAREVLVGRSVPQMMLGNMLFPTAVERKLVKIGTEVQLSNQPNLRRLDNLDATVEDYSTTSHGPYDDRASPHGIVVDGDLMRKAVVLGGVAALLATGMLLGRATAPGGAPRRLDRTGARPSRLRAAGL